MLIPDAALALTLLLAHSQSGPAKETTRITNSADTARRDGRFEEAIASYRQALAIDPAFLPARRGLGSALDLKGAHADARAEYLAAVEGRTDSREAASFFLGLAISYVFDRRFDDAHSALQRWAELSVTPRGKDPNVSFTFYELAMAGDAFDEAERMLDEHFAPVQKPPALTVAPPPDSHAIMSGLQWMRYNAARAVVSARRGRGADAQRFMAEAEAEAKNIDEVVRALVAAQGPGPPSLNAKRDLTFPQGEVAFRLGDTKRAIALLTTKDFVSPHYLVLLGQACEREHDLVAARAAYTRVVTSTELSFDLAWARPIAQARLAAIGR